MIINKITKLIDSISAVVFFVILLSPILLKGQPVPKNIEKIWIEAESGKIDSPFKIFYNQNASGGQFIEVAPGNNSEQKAPANGICLYEFVVKNSDVYKVFGRVIAPMNDEDAFWIKMDDGPWIRWKGIEVGCYWHWDKVHNHDSNDQEVIFNLTKGKHRFAVTYLLDGTQLDKLCITNDREFVPVKKGPCVDAQFDFIPEKPVVSLPIKLDGTKSLSDFGKIVKYHWIFGNNGSSADGVNAEHLYKNVGEYEVSLRVTDKKGNTGLCIKKITVYSGKPVAKFVYYPERARPDLNVTFDASASLDADGKIVRYHWDFGDGTNGSGVHINHSYRLEGEYKSKLTIVDDDGNISTHERTVIVVIPQPKKIIYETDMCLDVDDVGGLAILHALANKGEVELLAVCFNEIHPDGAAAIDVINTWYGRGDLPVGIYKGKFPKPDYSAYLTALTRFPHDLDQTNARGALDVYRKVLSTQADHSVTIISVGFLNNLNDLLKAEFDLVKQKVKELVIMAGVQHDGFNLIRHNLTKVSQNVLDKWPTPIVISQAGSSIKTGAVLQNTPVENPVREAYFRFFNCNFCDRSSWDEMAVLYGVRGLSNYFSEVTEGYGILNEDYRWKMQKGFRIYLENKLSDSEYKKIIEQLMIEPPKGE